MSAEDDVYHPKDTIGATIKSTLTLGGAGALTSAVQNSLAKQNVSAWGIFTRTGGTIATFGRITQLTSALGNMLTSAAAVGGTYAFVSNASANLREKDDALNAAFGGFFGGSMMGLRYRSIPAMFGYGAGAAILLCAYQYTGGTLRGYTHDPEVDEYDRKNELRRNRRRPIQETLDELGEGRGIYGPGYDERRRERIKQKYGIEVPAKS